MVLHSHTSRLSVGISAPSMDWTKSPNIPNLDTGAYPVTYTSMKVGSFPSLVMPDGYSCDNCSIPQRVSSDPAFT